MALLLTACDCNIAVTRVRTERKFALIDRTTRDIRFSLSPFSYTILLQDLRKTAGG
jgi:hypothetical protein